MLWLTVGLTNRCSCEFEEKLAHTKDDDIVSPNRSLSHTFFKLKILFKCTIRIVTPFLRKTKNSCHMRGVRKYNPSSNVWLTSPFLMGLKVAQTRLVSPDKGMVQHQRRIGSIRITSFEKKSYLFLYHFLAVYSTSMPSYHLFIKLHLLLTYYLLGLYQESK